MKWLAELGTLLLVLIIIGSIMIVPHLLRNDEQHLIGTNAYYYLRIAHDPFMKHDELSYGGREHVFQPYPLALFLTGTLFHGDLERASETVPFVIGILILIALYCILRKHHFNRIYSGIILTLLGISPPFLHMSTISNTYSLPLLLVLCAYLAFLFQKYFFAIFLTLFIPLFGIIHTLIAVFLLLIYGIATKRYMILPMVSLLVIGCIPFIFYGIPTLAPLARNQGFFSLLLSGSGGILSVSIFFITLAVIGLRAFWKEKYQHLPFYLLFIGLFLFSLYDPKIILYLNIPFIILAMNGLHFLAISPWHSRIFQYLIIGTLAAGLIFSTVIYVNNVSHSEPSLELFKSLETLKEESRTAAVVASHPDNGFYISTIAGKKNVMDEAYLFAPNVHERWSDLQTLFSTKNIDEAEQIIKKYDIKYVYIDRAMKEGQVWNANDEGLLFLLDASNKFQNIYSSNDAEIWQVNLYPSH